eukprot:gene14390-15923_t
MLISGDSPLLSKPPSKLGSSLSSLSSSPDLTDSVHKEFKSIEGSPLQNTVFTEESGTHDVKEKDVDSTLKKAEIDKSLVTQYLGEKSCVDS